MLLRLRPDLQGKKRVRGGLKLFIELSCVGLVVLHIFVKISAILKVTNYPT